MKEKEQHSVKIIVAGKREIRTLASSKHETKALKIASRSLAARNFNSFKTQGR